ncbi:Per1-like - like 3 [Theobroma cacao]|uniref:Post-GPI attachment to proteins factor 3 n=1 Tax=Theobroma cacao TaxID=3641 RepID=A0A061FA43_THECC|nr:Uncharacterized protein TCM_032399 isoform 1 [Theobroma cacao]EOY13759.1 Uncharacterized protein TCM_032399 isoform 1 [Theobroma cacao]WRX28463.1 Per1-like - like 3 [Theobroma cacao]
MKGWVVNGAAQPLIWVIWAAKTAHPCQWMLWVGVLGGGLAKLLEIYDSSPLQGIIDANAFCHAATILLTCILWSLLEMKDICFAGILSWLKLGTHLDAGIGFCNGS